jgi:hypothetical protein
MLKSRLKRISATGSRALHRLGAIEASIAALHNEDLLDLADIFPSKQGTPLGEIASVEMAKRGLSWSKIPPEVAIEG